MAHYISQFFAQYAHEPLLVYAGVCGFMLLSAFGLPLPEEVILVSSGLIAYMSHDPVHFPPADANAPLVDVHTLALVSFVAVISSDYLIFSIGRGLGPRLFRLRWFQSLVSEERVKKIQHWMWSYGYWAVVAFRFTPGIRFPGHLTIGAMKLSRWKFLLVDVIAAGLTVPTQIYLVAHYGQPILHYLGRFRIFAVLTVITIVCLVILKKISNGRSLNKVEGRGSLPTAE